MVPRPVSLPDKKQYVALLRKSPIYRTLRADKVVLALLETVMTQYFLTDGPDNLPVFAFAALKAAALEKRVHLFIGRIKGNISKLEIMPKEMTSTMGGGSLPGEELASFGIALKVVPGTISHTKLAKLLRQADPPVISTIASGLVLLDFRTIKEEDEKDLAGVLTSIDQLMH